MIYKEATHTIIGIIKFSTPQFATMRIGTSTLSLLALAAFACLLRPAQGHGYLAAPISRNYLHNTDYCPQCLNAGGGQGLSLCCGDTYCCSVPWTGG